MEILLEDPGSIVSHQQLYDAAWENSVIETSPNTLYQTILLVRTALKAVSESTEDFIITVPRQGFVFNEKMQVKAEDVVSTPGSEHRLTENVTPSSGSKEKW
ncbi:winged helix-turn-helix domain-containing protein [Klebsiella huaxiensis]|uniref:winged helix-turn-helix domain-containing protein n=1 Tax=Klebsiella huaxiensis TaxID=2153354 RepID=UPI00115B5A32|nr:winged helix-turn-helix domain-containing protein [Klebsiella huaxiensis]